MLLAGSLQVPWCFVDVGRDFLDTQKSMVLPYDLHLEPSRTHQVHSLSVLNRRRRQKVHFWRVLNPRRHQKVNFWRVGGVKKSIFRGRLTVGGVKNNSFEGA